LSCFSPSYALIGIVVGFGIGFDIGIGIGIGVGIGIVPAHWVIILFFTNDIPSLTESRKHGHNPVKQDLGFVVFLGGLRIAVPFGVGVGIGIALSMGFNSIRFR
jgi:hypothetical protein